MTLTQRSPTGLYLTGIMLLAAGTVLFGDRFVTRWAYAVERGKMQAANQELAGRDLAGVQQVSSAFRTVAKAARAGVVHIRVSGSRHGDFATGSGFIFDRDGYILTNNHVVADRESIMVQLADERIVDAKLVGTDRKTDLAVIKVDARDLHALPFGDSDDMEVGDWVLAVGAPFGLSQTVTHGIVSAKGRSRIPGVDLDYQDFLQTDASINPGNSGGPLLNMKAQAIGINTAIATDGENLANAGIAFTIPSNLARHVAESLKKGGKVERGWLGVRLDALSEAEARRLGVANGKGALVDVIYEGSPAAAGGLSTEDVIVSVNGRETGSVNELRLRVADISPGEAANFRIVRDGKERDLKLTVGTQPEDLRLGEGKPIVGRSIARLGLSVRSFEPTLPLSLAMLRGPLQQLGIEASNYRDMRGVLVVDRAGESSVITGVLPGELLVECNGTKIESVRDLAKALEALSAKDAIRLKVVNPDGDDRVVTVK